MLKSWGHYLPRLVNLGTRWKQLTNHSHMTLLGSEKQRGGTVLKHKRITSHTFLLYLKTSQKSFQLSKKCIINILLYCCFINVCLCTQVIFPGLKTGTNPAKCQSCLTQQSAETWEAGFQLPGHCVQLTTVVSTVRGHYESKRGLKTWVQRGLTSNWSWTLAPFFSRVSTTL